MVRARRPEAGARGGLAPRALDLAHPDTAAMLRRLPGVAVNRNGPLSLQPQLRGLSAYRVGARVDGIDLDPGGPNWMDPPLHYLPSGLVERIAVTRGIASVDAGPERIGGSFDAVPKHAHFAQGDRPELHGELALALSEADRGRRGAGIVWGATRHQRVEASASLDSADDLRTAAGHVHPSAADRRSYAFGYGVRFAGHTLGVDFRHVRTEDTGNPPLPMDMDLLDTDRIRIHEDWDASFGRLTLAFFMSDTDHAMDNFSHRPPPLSLSAYRQAKVTSEGHGYRLRLERKLARGELEVGLEGDRTLHRMRILNPNQPAFFVDNLNRALRRRDGAFAQWRGLLADRLETEVGVRWTRVASDAGRVDALPSRKLAPARRLRDRFNARHRARVDQLLDFVGRIAFEPDPSLRIDLVAARKERAPYYLERYLWLPLEVTAGLADGHNYVGDVGLRPEVAYALEGGLTWRVGALELRPRAFYRRVRRYIQGIPATDPDVLAVSGRNGDPRPLRYANVEAEFFGLDGGWRLALARGFDLSGTLSWVRARRKDTHDSLYRIVPLHGSVRLGFSRGGFWGSAEVEFAARQPFVARANGERPSPGYALLNLAVRQNLGHGLTLSGGVENVLNRAYRPHLAGRSRRASEAAAVGERLPGPGRSFHVELRWRW